MSESAEIWEGRISIEILTGFEVVIERENCDRLRPEDGVGIAELGCDFGDPGEEGIVDDTGDWIGGGVEADEEGFEPVTCHDVVHVAEEEWVDVVVAGMCGGISSGMDSNWTRPGPPLPRLWRYSLAFNILPWSKCRLTKDTRNPLEDRFLAN